MKTPTECKECGSGDLSWFTAMRNAGQAQDGRLRMHEVACDFVLGCNDCSETLAVISADQIAQHMTAQQQEREQGATLGNMAVYEVEVPHV